LSVSRDGFWLLVVGAPLPATLAEQSTKNQQPKTNNQQRAPSNAPPRASTTLVPPWVPFITAIQPLVTNRERV
jgi:hypothetical protein